MEAKKAKIKVPAGLDSSEAALFGFQMAVFLLQPPWAESDRDFFKVFIIRALIQIVKP